MSRVVVIRRLLWAAGKLGKTLLTLRSSAAIRQEILPRRLGRVASVTRDENRRPTEVVLPVEWPRSRDTLTLEPPKFRQRVRRMRRSVMSQPLVRHLAIVRVSRLLTASKSLR